jgi:hypothetical protein
MTDYEAHIKKYKNYEGEVNKESTAPLLSPENNHNNYVQNNPYNMTFQNENLGYYNNQNVYQVLQQPPNQVYRNQNEEPSFFKQLYTNKIYLAMTISTAVLYAVILYILISYK